MIRQTGVDMPTADWISRQHKIIINTTADPITKAGFMERYAMLTDLDLQDRVVWVTDDLELENLFQNVVSWPRDLACAARRLQRHYHPKITPGPRQTRVSCLNRQFRPHRAYLIWLLKMRDYFNELIVSCRAYVHSYTGESMTLDHEWFQELPRGVRQSMQHTNLYYESMPTDTQWSNDHAFDHTAFADTYLNIVTESLTEPGVYFSEKMFKPLAAGQLFLLAGCPRSVRYLRRLGFECFDTALKQHSYERSDNWMIRIESMLTLLDEIYQIIPDVYHDNLDQITHNWHWVRSADFLKKCERSLVKHDLIRCYHA